MPLSYLKRPLFLALAAYMILLAILHARGFFEIRVPGRLLEWRRRSVEVEGRIVSPRREDGRGVKYTLGEARVDGEAVGAKVLAYLPRGSLEILPGQTVSLTGVLRLPRRPRNPGEFDERAFLSERGVGWLMQAREARVLDAPIPARWKIAAWAERTRLSMQSRFEGAFETTDARLLTGMTLGYKAPIPRELNRAIQDAGAMHLLVPSGAKVAFVLLAVELFSSLAGLPPWARLSAAAMAGGFYTVMVGGEPPYARAYIAALALGLGLIADRETGAFQAVVLSAWLILLAEPRALFSAGFQMTYAAMAGLVTAMPQVNAALPGHWPKALRGLICVAAVTFIVQLMLWPIFANTFGRAAVLGACANLVLVPLSGVILASGFSFCVFPIPAKPIELLLAVFRRICYSFASLPWAATDLLPIPTAYIVAYYGFVATLLVLPRKKVAAILAIAAVLILITSSAIARFNEKPLRIVYLSLPGRPAIAFQNGKTYLIGEKPPKAPVKRAMKALGLSPGDPHVLIKEAGNGFKLCEGNVCFLFAPPAVRRGSEEFDIIASRLEKSAVEASTDGSTIQLQGARRAP